MNSLAHRIIMKKLKVGNVNSTKRNKRFNNWYIYNESLVNQIKVKRYDKIHKTLNFKI